MENLPASRRDFLKHATLAAASAVVPGSRLFRSGATGRRPNLLLIMTDQQFADAMSCVIGRDYVNTPNMDSLAANGVRFTRAYCANPLCTPSRASMFTGRYPHQTGIQTNTEEMFSPGRFTCMGRIFKAAGYETGFFGKWHMPFDVTKPEEHGFDVYVNEPALYEGAPAAEFIRKERAHPFLAVASFVNPHDICQWSRGEPLIGSAIGDPPPLSGCPPLKPNMAPQSDEPDIMTHMRRAYQAHRLFPVGNFADDKWRQYLWAYYRLVEKVDQNIGTVLDALAKSKQENNTVIVFLSDHGECHGTHRWNQKTVFYEESARVPMIITQRGKTRRGLCDVLVNTGVDLIPTLCEFAGIREAGALPGTSLRACALGRARAEGRPYVVASNHMVQCEPIDGVLLQPEGRMVRSRRYKYCLQSHGLRRESLVDLKDDPGEKVNLARKPNFLKVLLEHRGYLEDFAREQEDQAALSMLKSLDSI